MDQKYKISYKWTSSNEFVKNRVFTLKFKREAILYISLKWLKIMPITLHKYRFYKCPLGDSGYQHTHLSLSCSQISCLELEFMCVTFIGNVNRYVWCLASSNMLYNSRKLRFRDFLILWVINKYLALTYIFNFFFIW